MDQEQYLEKRTQKALKIADELGFIIEHTLGIPTQTAKKLGFFHDFREDHEDYFQGRKLYKLMKDFIDLSFKADENGEYPEEIINKYLEDMDHFSFHPKLEEDVFEFTIQDHVYKVEVVLNGILSMTLHIKNEWIQTRAITLERDFAAIVRILDIMKGIYQVNPYMDEKPFFIFYNKVVKIADNDAPKWRDVEKKIFVPHSVQNDIYVSPYNSKEFIVDLIKEMEATKNRLHEIENPNEREAAESFLNLMFKARENFSGDFFNMENLAKLFPISNIESNKSKGNFFQSKVFQDVLKNLGKKYNVIVKFKELVDELKTFSDVKSPEEMYKEAEKDHGYEAVKQLLIDKKKEEFISKALQMTIVDSVDLVTYIFLESDSFILDRSDIFLELVLRPILPLQNEHYQRIGELISTDPISLLRKLDLEATNELFGDKEYGIIESDPEIKDFVETNINFQLDIIQKFGQEQEDLVKSIAKELSDELDELEAQNKIKWEEPIVDGKVSEYFQEALNKSIEKLASSDLIQKIVEEAKKL